MQVISDGKVRLLAQEVQGGTIYYAETIDTDSYSKAAYVELWDTRVVDSSIVSAMLTDYLLHRHMKHLKLTREFRKHSLD